MKLSWIADVKDSVWWLALGDVKYRTTLVTDLDLQ